MRGGMAVFALLPLVLAGIVGSQPPAMPPPIPPQGLQGVITDIHGDGLPEDVYINLTAEGEEHPGPSGAIRGGEGPREYHIWLSAGNYSVTVEAAGYFPANATVRVPPREWVWQNFTLAPKGSLATDGSAPDSAARAVGVPVVVGVAALVVVALILRRRR